MNETETLNLSEVTQHVHSYLSLIWGAGWRFGVAMAAGVEDLDVLFRVVLVAVTLAYTVWKWSTEWLDRRSRKQQEAQQ